MAPLLETMARGALVARIARLEETSKRQGLVIASLISSLWHHLKDRHDAEMATDDAPDVVAIATAKRTALAATAKPSAPARTGKSHARA